MNVANERASNGNVPVDALLGALRRAAEQDGVDDVDAVVAEFATFVRARAPHLATASSTRPARSGTWTTALLCVGAVATLAIGAVTAGVVSNPLRAGRTATTATADAPSDPAVALLPSDAPLDGTGTGGAATGRSTNTPDAGAAAVSPFTDPDALAVVAEQQLEAGAAESLAATGGSVATDAETTASEPSDGAATSPTTVTAATAATNTTNATNITNTTAPADRTDPAGAAAVDGSTTDATSTTSTSPSAAPPVTEAPLLEPQLAVASQDAIQDASQDAPDQEVPDQGGAG